jgi:diamine N-acetyltransferase
MTELQGKRVRLRPSTLDDLRPVWAWANQSDIAPWANAFQDPATYEEFCRDWKTHYFDGSAERLGRIFIIEVSSRPVGMIAYNDLDDEHRRVEIDIWLSCEASCGHGYGSDAIATLCEHLHNTFGLREIWAQPSERNPRSIRAFQKAGFQRIALPSRDAFLEYGPRDTDDSVLLSKEYHAASRPVKSR